MWDSGALYCEFENSLGKYAFKIATYDGINGNDKCFAISLNAKHVFTDFNEKIAIPDLAKALNCEIVSSFNEMNGNSYFSSFKYKEYTVMLNTTDKKIIEENTNIDIVIK